MRVTSGNFKEVTEKILELLRARAEYLKEVGDRGTFPSKYFVFNNETGVEEIEAFVLNPGVSSADINALQLYSKECKNRVVGMSVEDWLRGYTDFRCSSSRRGRCPINGSTVCCAHCPDNNICVLQPNSPICSLVMLGDVVDISDCEEV